MKLILMKFDVIFSRSDGKLTGLFVATDSSGTTHRTMLRLPRQHEVFSCSLAGNNLDCVFNFFPAKTVLTLQGDSRVELIVEKINNVDEFGFCLIQVHLEYFIFIVLFYLFLFLFILTTKRVIIFANFCVVLERWLKTGFLSLLQTVAFRFSCARA
jgi:hypothetical protein